MRLTWYWLHSRKCPNPKCGHVTRARAPNAVGQSPFGRNLHIMCSILVGRFHQSRRLVSELLRVIYNFDVAASTLSNMEKRTSAALAGPVKEVREHLRGTDLLHCDETGWREALGKAWMWVFASPEVACFKIDPSRGGKVVRGVIGRGLRGHLGGRPVARLQLVHPGLLLGAFAARLPGDDRVSSQPVAWAEAGDPRASGPEPARPIRPRRHFLVRVAGREHVDSRGLRERAALDGCERAGTQSAGDCSATDQARRLPLALPGGREDPTNQQLRRAADPTGRHPTQAQPGHRQRCRQPLPSKAC